MLLNKLVAGIRDGDGRSRDPEPAVPGPGGHVRRRDGPAGTRPAGAHHHPVLKYWTPEDYKALEDYGYELGFSHVASGPMVRSSYHADVQAKGAGIS